MHLDLSPMLPSQVIQDIETVVGQFGSCSPNMLWPLWLRKVDTETTSINILQSAAQRLASFGCMTATLRFGLYCSRYFEHHGNVLSDEVALYYLRMSFKVLAVNQGPPLKWLRHAEGFEYAHEHKPQFWTQACAVFAHHEYDENPTHLDASLEFAFHFLLNGD